MTLLSSATMMSRECRNSSRSCVIRSLALDDIPKLNPKLGEVKRPSPPRPRRATPCYAARRPLNIRFSRSRPPFEVGEVELSTAMDR